MNETVVEESDRLLDTTVPSTVHEEYTFTPSDIDWKRSYIKVHKRNSFLVTLSIINCMMGAQTYSLPYATYQTGIWMSIIINLYKCIIGIISCKILIECQLMSKWNLPAKIGYFCFGRKAIFVVCSLIGIGGLFQAAAYFKVFADVLSVMLTKVDKLNGSFWSSNYFASLILFFLLLMIISKKQFSDLKWPSMFHIAGILFLVIFLIVQIGTGKGHGIGGHHVPAFNMDIRAFSSMPTFLLAYGCQTSFVPSMNTARKRHHGMKIAISAFLSIFVIYTMIILIVIYLYGSNVEDNFLNNIQEGADIFSILILLSTLITSAMHVPFVFFLGKDSTLTIVDELLRRSYSTEQERRMSIRAMSPVQSVALENLVSTKNTYLSMNPVHYYAITFLLYVFIVLCSLAIKSITLFLSIVGANASTLALYLLPPMLYIKCYHLSKKNVEDDPKQYVPSTKTYLIISWIFIVKGLTFLVILNFVTFYKLA